MKDSNLNKLFFNKIYFYTLNHNWAKKTAIAISEFSKPLFVVIYLVGVIISATKNIEVIKFLAVPFFTLIFNTTVRKVLNKPRPFLNDGVEKLVEHKESGSFPSNHACSSMIIALSYILVYPPMVLPLAIMAIFTGLSRVMTGVHYPFDIVAGWFVSLLSGLIFYVIL